MREKELRLALICYGGISLAIYMHGVTREVWHLARGSRAFHDDTIPSGASERIYAQLLALIQKETGIRLRILPDIVAGASAGGINGVFLAQAVATGQSLEPLTDLWLRNADVDLLLDPDARPMSAFTKFWAMPIAAFASGRRGGTVERTVDPETRAEVRAKLSRFVRARWFEPPFGGAEFTGMLLDAFDSMETSTHGKRLLPEGQPLDLFVTVTDFTGHPQSLKLNSPPRIAETEHRLILAFTDSGEAGSSLGDTAELAFAARATASFPGAFPPLNVAEIDGVLKARDRDWPSRSAFLARAFPGPPEAAGNAILIDGSVLANAPFRPAIEALRDRPARREVDRRFVYIDPKPGQKSVRLTRKGNAELPGFFATILGAMSDIPREQPIRDSLEAIEGRSSRIRRMQRITEAMRPDVENTIETLFGRTFFLDRPTATRVKSWREKAHERATRDAGYAYSAYAHAKLSTIVEDIARLVARQDVTVRDEAFESVRQSLWDEIRARGIDQVTSGPGKGASSAIIGFFRAHDLGFRIRRLRFVLRTVSHLLDTDRITSDEANPIRTATFQRLADYLDRERMSFYAPFETASAAALLDSIARQRDLLALDEKADIAFADAFSACPRAERRAILFAYLGFPFYDLTSLPMLQGEGLHEFDPIKVDRISPDDAQAIRSGVATTLKGTQFNNFGAFFSRSYRENDYLWGRLHGAERLFDIVASSASIAPEAYRTLKYDLLDAIVTEEEGRLEAIGALLRTLRLEIAARRNAP
jgi:patatin-related protein